MFIDREMASDLPRVTSGLPLAPSCCILQCRGFPPVNLPRAKTRTLLS